MTTKLPTVVDQVKRGIREYYLITGNAPNALTACKETLDKFAIALYEELGGLFETYVQPDEETGNTVYISTYGKVFLYENETVAPGRLMVHHITGEDESND